MTPSNDLHVLIHSLDKNERTWFANHAEKGSDYKRLYDAILKQKEYDQEKIIEQFKNENFIRRFSATKNYLFQSIIHVLQLKHENDNQDTYFSTQINHCEILMKKGLLKTAHKKIQKIKKQCLDNEQYLQALQAISIERLIIRYKRDYADLQKQMHTIYREELNLIEKYKNYADYLFLYIELMAFRNQTFIARTSNEQSFYKKLLKHPLLLNENFALTSSSKLNFNRIKGECLASLGQHQKAVLYRERAVQICEKRQSMNEGALRSYSISLTELGFNLYNVKKINKALSIAQSIRALEKECPETYSGTCRIILFGLWVSLELHIYFHSGRFKQGQKRLDEEIERAILKHAVSNANIDLFTINCNAIFIYYGANQHKKALRKIAAIINENEDNIGNDVVCFMHLFRLIIHIDLGNDKLLFSIANSTENFLRKRKRLYHTEILILDLAKKITAKSYLNRVDLFKSVKKKFDRIRRLSAEKKLIDFFDFSVWLTSHIEQKTYAEVFRKMHPEK